MRGGHATAPVLTLPHGQDPVDRDATALEGSSPTHPTFTPKVPHTAACWARPAGIAVPLWVTSAHDRLRPTTAGATAPAFRRRALIFGMPTIGLFRILDSFALDPASIEVAPGRHLYGRNGARDRSLEAGGWRAQASLCSSTGSSCPLAMSLVLVSRAEVK